MPTTRLPWAAAGPAMVRNKSAAKTCFIGPVYLDQPRRLIQKNVDKDACHRDVQPDRQRPARDRAMTVETRLQAARKRDDRQRRHGRGQCHMCNKNAEVQRADRSEEHTSELQSPCNL